MRGAYFHTFLTNDQIGRHTCVGPKNLRWPIGAHAP